jgi:hypothetical protein
MKEEVMNLHHITYARAGNGKEPDSDLVWLCRHHHEQVHEIEKAGTPLSAAHVKRRKQWTKNIKEHDTSVKWRSPKQQTRATKTAAAFADIGITKSARRRARKLARRGKCSCGNIKKSKTNRHCKACQDQLIYRLLQQGVEWPSICRQANVSEGYLLSYLMENKMIDLDVVCQDVSRKLQSQQPSAVSEHILNANGQRIADKANALKGYLKG